MTAFLLASVFAMTGFLRVLAEATSAILMVVFFCMNLAVVVIRIRKIPPDDPAKPFFRTPVALPALGLLITGYLVSEFTPGAYLRALLLVGTGAVLYLAHRALR